MSKIEYNFVTRILNSSQRFKPANLAMMEGLIESSIRAHTYHSEPFLGILKMYHFHPKKVNGAITAKVLLKCLTNNPSTDFYEAKNLLLPAQLHNPAVQAILEFGLLLEQQDFVQFWNKATVNTPLFRMMGMPLESICQPFRQHIAKVLTEKHDALRVDALQELLDIEDEAELKQFAKAQGWKVQRNRIVVLNKNLAAQSSSSAKPSKKSAKP